MKRDDSLVDYSFKDSGVMNQKHDPHWGYDGSDGIEVEMMRGDNWGGSR
jgi:hypothetical protein